MLPVLDAWYVGLKPPHSLDWRLGVVGPRRPQSSSIGLKYWCKYRERSYPTILMLHGVFDKNGKGFVGLRNPSLIHFYKNV